MSDLLYGFTALFSISTFLFMNIGVLVGIIIGSIPGLTGTIGIILFLPFSYVLPSTDAFMLLLGIFVGGEFGGAISAILIGTPGDNASAATMIDGYPLAKQGKARKALTMALYSSGFGSIFSGLALLFFAPMIAGFAIHFGPAEMFSLAVFGLSVIASISGNSIWKGFVAAGIGVMVALVGIDNMTGVQRFTFGNVNMLRGLSLMPVLMGLFAIPSILQMVSSPNKKDAGDTIELDKQGLSFAEVKSTIATLIRASFIGTLIGAVPGPGTGIAAFMSYDTAKKASKNPETFGKGNLNGIAASEAASNAVTGGSLIPLFTLGVPGGPSAAVLMGAFMIHGMVPGPSLFRDQGALMFSIMIGMIFIKIFMVIQGKFLIKAFSYITKVPNSIMAPVLLVICTAGAFSVNNSIFDVGVFYAFGFFAFIIGKLGFPVMPISLGYVLGSMAEFQLRRALVFSGGSFTIFFTRPISLLFVVITVLTVGFTVYSNWKSKKRMASSIKQ
ncbi:MAG: tripartite tricarboxylate transporter permease [Defluviitaleaceae bacterium]|nr:tripartite tricarboxylate transporter permease [Defluviitaleaceae bacterium]